MKQLARYTPEFVLVCYILIFVLFKHPSNNWERVINSDGKGYYAYLPAIFIYHDLDFNFVEYYEDKYYPPDKAVFKEFRVRTDGGIVNKCFPGLAILWLPFFLLAHLLSHLAGFEPDGYSILYQYAVAFASLFYLWLGCRFLYKLLLNIGSREKPAAFATLVIGLGTNLIYYTIIEGSMTHVYSFALITLFLFSVHRLFVLNQGRWFLLAVILFSLIVITRPVNGLVILLVPLMRSLAGKVGNAGFVIRDHLKNITAGLVLMMIVFAIPPLLWHQQTGHWIVYSYSNEHFNFSDPHFFPILFSYNRGWFVYTPIAFLALAGFPGLYRRSRSGFAWLSAFLLIFIFIASSWWMWFYASKCGQRVFVDILSVTGILLLFLLIPLRNRNALRWITGILLIALTGLNLLQFYQHSRWIFPSVNIDRTIYWNSFFSLHPVARVNIPDEAVLSGKSYFNDMEKPKGWMNEGTVTGSLAWSFGRSSMVTSSNPYSVGLAVGLDSVIHQGNNVIRVSAMVQSIGKRSGASVVADFGSAGKGLYYKAFYIEPFATPGKWTKIETAFYIPRDLPGNAYAKIYFFLPAGSVPLFIDDMKIEFLSLKDEQIYSRLEGVLMPGK